MTIHRIPFVTRLENNRVQVGDKKKKTRIGEENELLFYVRNYIKVKFPKEYEEFNKLTFDYELP